MLEYALLFSILSLLTASIGLSNTVANISRVVGNADIAKTASALFFVTTLFFVLPAISGTKITAMLKKK